MADLQYRHDASAESSPSQPISRGMLLVALIVGLLWIFGLGSLFATFVSAKSLLRDRPIRSLAVVVLIVGVLGLLLTVLSAAVVVGSSPTAEP